MYSFRLDPELVGRVDGVAGVRGRTRFVVAALEAALGLPDKEPVVPVTEKPKIRSGTARATPESPFVLPKIAPRRQS